MPVHNPYDVHDAGDFGELPDGTDAGPTGRGAFELEVYDYEDRRVAPGTTVYYFDVAPIPEARGIVVDVSDFDGDVDDDTGRSITIAPYVYVLFPGCRLPERFPTSEWEHDYCSHHDSDGYPAFCHCFSVGKVEELLVWRDYSGARG